MVTARISVLHNYKNNSLPKNVFTLYCKDAAFSIKDGCILPYQCNFLKLQVSYNPAQLVSATKQVIYAKYYQYICITNVVYYTQLVCGRLRELNYY